MGTNQNSGVTVSNLSVGGHIISFTPISGWNTPSKQTITIMGGVTTWASGIYTQSGTTNAWPILLTNGDGTIQHALWPKSLLNGKEYNRHSRAQGWKLLRELGGGISDAPGNGTYVVLSTSASYKFMMEPSLVLEANFVTNVFMEAKGVYRGLFSPTDSARQQSQLRLLFVQRYQQRSRLRQS